MHKPPLFAIATLLAAGCTSGAPALAPPARIEFTHANPVFCGQSGSPICEARVDRVDGRPVLTLSAHAEVAPGPRVLGLFCRINLSIMIGDAQSYRREIEVDLEPGARYRLEASMTPAPCSMTLVKERP